MTVRAALAFLCALALATPAVAQETTTIKFATLAPDSSSWMKVFKRAAKEITKKTGGAVKLKIYGGGTQGDEKVVVEKMRTGQLHAAALTSIGLSEIAPEILVLQAPGLILDYKTLDKVRDTLRPRFEKAMLDKGFVQLGDGDVGVVYFYSAHEIRGPKDLNKGKFWVWNADATAREVANVAGVTPVPLAVPDVYPSLQTGHVDTFYSSPLATVSLQWFSKVKYRNTQPLTVTVGAVVVTQKMMDTLSPEHQTIVRETISKWSRALVKKVRKDNDKATKILRKKGIADIEPTPEDIKAFEDIAKKVQDNLAGKIYPKALLEEVRALVGQ